MGNLMIRVGGVSVPVPRGPRGQTGPTGPTGPANTLSIGTVTTGSPGTSASASVAGTAPNQTLSFTIPRGDVGPANSLSIGTVTTGAPGSSASSTITGTAPSQTLNLTIPRGDAGPANSLSIGTVTTGAAGSSASATITGTAPTQTLSFTIPRGDPGSVNNHTHPTTDIVPGTLDGMAFKKYSEVLTTLTSAATTTLDLSNGMSFVVNQTMNSTLAITNVDATANRVSSVNIILKQDATGGRTIGWPTGTKWPNGIAPVLTTTANATNVVTLMTTDGGATWLGFLSGVGMA